MPPLRFPEFSDRWTECELQEISHISKGFGISKDQLSETGLPCILYGELYTKYKSEIITDVLSKTDIDDGHLVRSKKNDVIIPSSGETAIDISTARCVPFDNILLGGDLTIIRLCKHDGRFFSYQLNGVRKFDIAKAAQGVSVVHLYGENLKRLKVKYPSIDEQIKISSLLALIDERIATQSRIIEDLEQLKSAIYHRVFSTIKGKTVELKFIANIVKGKQLNGTELSENGNYYVMNGGIVPSGFYHEYNTPADTISISEGGNSCGYVQFNCKPFWSGGHCYTLHIEHNEVNLQFLYHFLKYREKDIMALRIGSGLPNIQKKDLGNFSILLPAINEQNKVVCLFDAIQQKADVDAKLLNQLLLQKQYLLQQMFI